MTVQTRHELARWLDVLGCPYCRAPLRQNSESLACAECGHSFLILHGIPSLVREKDRAHFAAFSRRYREFRLGEGWRPLSVDQALALPYGSPPGYLPLYWEVRRQSFRALMRLLACAGPSPQSGVVADLGAGTGWLSYRLARAGYRVLAIEASLDEDFGLQATKVYRAQAPERLLPVQGDLEHPPLAQGKTSLVLLNASLHYASDLVETLRRATATLQPKGCLFVIDTPVARRPQPGTGIGDRHLGREELGHALAAAGLSPNWMRIPRSWRWWARQIKARLAGDALFSFPIIRACRTGSQSFIQLSD